MKIIDDLKDWFRRENWNDLKFRESHDEYFIAAVGRAISSVKHAHPEYFEKEGRIKRNFEYYYLLSFSKRFLGEYIGIRRMAKQNERKNS